MHTGHHIWQLPWCWTLTAASDSCVTAHIQPSVRTKFGDRSFSSTATNGPSIWNTRFPNLYDITDTVKFIRSLKSQFYNLACSPNWTFLPTPTHRTLFAPLQRDTHQTRHGDRGGPCNFNFCTSKVSSHPTCSSAASGRSKCWQNALSELKP